MPTTRVYECDEPTCHERDEPEEAGERRHPYGWVRARITLVGSGPSATVCVCSTAHLEGAVDAALAAHYRADRGVDP